MATTPAPLRVGYVPEHFSTPLHFAQSHGFFSDRSLSVQLLPYPSGTGHMIKSLQAGELDLAIGLTEGWIASQGNGCKDFHLVGEYVSTPLCWAISTGAAREDMKTAEADLKPTEDKTRKLGVSRIGSGSYVMGFVLADQNGWLNDEKDPFDFLVLDNFKNLREAVNGEKADAFMWEYFTTKKYYDSGEIRQIGSIYTPWPSWHIVAHSSLTSSVSGGASVASFLKAVNEGVKYFEMHKDEAVQYIADNMDYSKEDAETWLTTVEFSHDCRKVRPEVVKKTVGILKKAGVIKDDSQNLEGFVKDFS
ncbi:hypothetical protein EDC01DRAFT_710344 [Geopyxis carbonaria]|nr:hypothetical protein EDC01DRAFT_710344 [Geopyxis carbonaria]